MTGAVRHRAGQDGGQENSARHLKEAKLVVKLRESKFQTNKLERAARRRVSKSQLMRADVLRFLRQPALPAS